MKLWIQRAAILSAIICFGLTVSAEESTIPPNDGQASAAVENASDTPSETAADQNAASAAGEALTPVPTQEPEDPAVTLIKNVQEALNKAGYNCGAVDGIQGPATNGAIQSFRRDRHMGGEYNVVIDEALLYALGITHDLVWDPFHSIEDMHTVVKAGKGYGQELIMGMEKIGASWDRDINLGNYIQRGSSSFHVGIKVKTEDELLLATLACDQGWKLESIRNFDTGDYYYYNGDDSSVIVEPYGGNVLAARSDTLDGNPQGGTLVQSAVAEPAAEAGQVPETAAAEEVQPGTP
ncbi:MAG: hypothetical protein IIY55_09975 [Blautia sp.]|nr:hypothetical protein [Blautia sp.]